MSLMPTAILAGGCVICDSLLLVNMVSTFTAATSSVQYVANSQYWFLVTFDFTGASFIPTFQFTVQINPIYASYFTSADMAQKLVSALSPQTTYKGINPSFRSNFQAAGVPSSSPITITTQIVPKLTNTQLSSIFVGSA
jgi:hypothetical protein